MSDLAVMSDPALAESCKLSWLAARVLVGILLCMSALIIYRFLFEYRITIVKRDRKQTVVPIERPDVTSREASREIYESFGMHMDDEQ